MNDASSSLQKMMISYRFCMTVRFITSILDAWRDEKPPKIATYTPGSWGPSEANRLAYGCHIGWREPLKSKDGHLEVRPSAANG